MTGATLSPTLMRGLQRVLGEQNISDVRITIREEGGDFEAPDRQLTCSHCAFSAQTAAEMTQHRWEVHPLLTRRKQHLVTSPKGGRKRPNLESSEEGKYMEPEDAAPKKKLSPSHVMMTSCESDSHDVCGHVRRTGSADEVLKNNQSETHRRRKSHSVGDLSYSKHFVTSHVRQSSEGNCKCDDVTRLCSPAPSTDLSSTAATVTSYQTDAEDDLHTLARAALSAAPIPWKGATSNPTQPQAIPQPWLACLPGVDQAFYVNNNRNISFPVGDLTALGGLADLGGHFAAGDPSMLGRYFQDNTRILPLPSALFSNPNQAPFTVGSYPPGPGLPVSLPIYIPPSNEVQPPHSNKLSTLSHVASRYLIGGQVLSSDNAKTGEGDPEQGKARAHVKKNVQKPPVATMLVAKPAAGGAVTVEKKPHQSLPQQRLPEGKQVMDDDRVRSLEDALSKIDCCDPTERSNMLPYRCSDGKWRMVRSKCVGGAWVVQVPGAVQPSVYVPLQRDAQPGTLNNWLKERLASTPQPTQSQGAHYAQVNPLTLHQQRCAADARIKPVAAGGRNALTRTGAIQPLEGGAIKNLLLKNTAVRS